MLIWGKRARHTDSNHSHAAATWFLRCWDIVSESHHVVSHQVIKDWPRGFWDAYWSRPLGVTFVSHLKYLKHVAAKPPGFVQPEPIISDVFRMRFVSMPSSHHPISARLQGVQVPGVDEFHGKSGVLHHGALSQFDGLHVQTIFLSNVWHHMAPENDGAR